MVHAVGRKPATRDEEAEREDGRQSMARCQRDDEIAVVRGERARLVGGDLKIRSELGEGTTVTLHVP